MGHEIPETRLFSLQSFRYVLPSLNFCILSINTDSVEFLFTRIQGLSDGKIRVQINRPSLN